MNETFGQRFLRLRRAKGLTQEDVALKVNISSQAVSKWENDISLPDITVLPILSELLDVTIDELLGNNKTHSVKMIEKLENRDINKMILRINIISSDGDKLKLNVPIALIKICIESGTQIFSINGSKALESIDFKQVYELIEQGVMGELLSMETEDGDCVSIVVE